MADEWKERITVDPKVLAGKPIIKGTRIAVEFIIDLLANGWTNEKILKNYPQLKKEEITAAMKYATANCACNCTKKHLPPNEYTTNSSNPQNEHTTPQHTKPRKRLAFI